MEDHLRDGDRLDADWAAISNYESEEAVPCEAASRPENAFKNRAGCPLPCKLAEMNVYKLCLCMCFSNSIA